MYYAWWTRQQVKVIQEQDVKRARQSHLQDLKEFVFKPLLIKLGTLTYSPNSLLYNVDEEHGEIKIQSKYILQDPDHILFQDLRNHFPNMTEDWEELKKRLLEYNACCLAFVGELSESIAKRAEMTCWDAKGPAPERYVTSCYLTMLIYDDLIKDLGHFKRLTVDPSEDKKDGFYVLRNATKYAHGKKEDIERCKSIIANLLESQNNKDTATYLIKQAGELARSIISLERKLKELDLMNKLQGDCPYCMA